MPRKAVLLARDVFPGWMHTGPWPYEVGMIFLLLWDTWCLLHGDVVLAAQGATAFSNMVSASHSVHVVLLSSALVLAAGLLVGFGLLLTGNRETANRVRGASILGAAVYSLWMAGLFLSSVDYSLAGGAYAFIAWRAFCVGVRLWWEPHDARPGG